MPKDEEQEDQEAISSIVEDEGQCKRLWSTLELGMASKSFAMNLEPAACKIDSWAQGYVPSLFLDEPKMLVDLEEDER